MKATFQIKQWKSIPVVLQTYRNIDESVQKTELSFIPTSLRNYCSSFTAVTAAIVQTLEVIAGLTE